MMMKASSTPNYDYIANRMRNAIYGFEIRNRRDYQNPPNSDVSFQALKETIQNTDTKPVTTQSIRNAIDNRWGYWNTRHFDNALFNALKHDLYRSGIKWKYIKQRERKEKSTDQWIILTDMHLQHEDRFIGFAQQATIKDGRNGPNHACCIFKRSRQIESGKSVTVWEVEGIFSVVDLKMRDTSSSCSGFLLDWNTEDPIVEVISYVFDYVWPSICRFGLNWNDCKMESLTFALIAAPQSRSSSSTYRWVSGSFHPKKTWGDSFGVCKIGAEKFEEDDSATNAANIYVEVMLEGIQLAKMAFDAWKKSGPAFPSPLAGLPFEGMDDYVFCASPLLSAKDLEQFKGEGDHKKYLIYQGELYYYKKLDLRKLFHNWYQYTTNRWLCNEPVVEDVFVKVWSKGIHRGLQSQGDYSCAYEHITYRESLKNLLSGDLIGVKTDPAYTVTVMRRIKGDPVTVKDNGDISNHWKLFKGLCKEVLLPLADAGIIHSDLRPGYDWTANILIETTDEGTKMKIIDYESLCCDDRYGTPGQWGPRYPNHYLLHEKKMAKAYDILFQQCIGVAYAWIEEINESVFDFDDALAWWGVVIQPELDGETKCTRETRAFRWWAEEKERGKHEAFTELFRMIDHQVEATKDRKPLSKRPRPEEEEEEEAGEQRKWNPFGGMWKRFRRN